MSKAKKTNPKETAPIESVVRAALLAQDAEIPLTPAEVAAYEARHLDDPPLAITPSLLPSPRFSWERDPGPVPAAPVIAFRSPVENVPLVYAARAGSPTTVSPETRSQVARLIEKMKREKSHVQKDIP